MARVTLGSGETITIGGTTDVFGTTGEQTLNILDGSTVNFRGGFNSGETDTIRLNGNASDFVVSAVGLTVTLYSAVDNIRIVLPIGSNGANIVFDNGDTRTITREGTNGTKIGDQLITATPVALTEGPGVYEVTSSGEVLEGGVLTFTVTRTDTTTAETLQATAAGFTNGGTVDAADQGADFTVAGAQIVFAVGQATATFTISAPLDAEVEGIEGLQVTILNSDQEAVATTTALILDGTPEGQTFQLTPGLDTVGTGAPTDLVGSGNNTGTGGNDTIVAVTGEVNLLNPNLGLTGTLTPFDNINGGDGDDTLLVLDNGNPFTSAPNFTGVTVDNVENLDYRAPTRGFLNGDFNANTAGFDGLESATFFIDGGGTQTITLDDETTSTAPNGTTPTDVNTSVNVTQIGNGNLVINGGGDSAVVNAAGGNVTIGGSTASNSFETVSVTGGNNIRVTDRGTAQELASVLVAGSEGNISVRGAAVTAIGISNLAGDDGFRDIDVDVNDDAVITLSQIGDPEDDEFDQDFDIESEGDITVVTDGTVFGMADLISKGSNVDLISNGDLRLSDINALGENATVSIEANGDVELDNIDGGDENGVPDVFGNDDGDANNDVRNVVISGTGSVTMTSVQEANNDADKETTITSTNAGGVTISNQLGDDTQFNGSGNTGDDDITFGATSEDNTFGGGDDLVTFNSDAFGTDLNDLDDDDDDTSGSFDGGEGIDTLAMESNNAATFTEDEQAVSNFETLFLTGQDVAKADVIDLHNIGLDEVSNVISNVGGGSEPEITTLTFGNPASSTDTVTISGNGIDVEIVLVDGDTPATIADKVADFINGLPVAGASGSVAPGYIASADGDSVTIEGPAGLDANISVDFDDATTIGTPGLEQVTGGPVTITDGAAAFAGTASSFTLELNDVLVNTGDDITYSLTISGVGSGSFTFVATGDLSSVTGELATFIAQAANADPDFAALFTATVVGDDVQFTANSPGSFVGTVGGSISTEPGVNPAANQVIGTPPTPAIFEVQQFTLDGVATGDDELLFDGATITFEDGDLPADLAAAFVDQYNDVPLEDRTWTASNVGALVTLTANVAGNLDPLTPEDLVFEDIDNVGTPGATVTVDQQASVSSVTLNNFVAGSTLTLLAAEGDHTVNLKDDGDADVLDIVLGADGDHGVVTADEVEIVTISTSNEDLNGEEDEDPTPQPGEGDTDALLLEGELIEEIVVSGSDGLALDTNSVIISSIDASDEAGFFSWSADAGQDVDITVSTGAGGSRLDFSLMEIQGGVSSTGDAPVTVLGGSGDDFVITGNAGTSRGTITTGGGVDTVVVGIVDGGNDFWTITDFDDVGGTGNEDVLLFVNEAEFVEQVQLLEPTATFQDYLDAAARGNTADDNFVDGGVSYFYFEGNTYVVQDNTDAEDFVDGTDTVIRLDGIKVLGDINIGTAGEDDYPAGTPVPDMMPEVAMMDFSVV